MPSCSTIRQFREEHGVPQRGCCTAREGWHKGKDTGQSDKKVKQRLWLMRPNTGEHAPNPGFQVEGFGLRTRG